MSKIIFVYFCKRFQTFNFMEPCKNCGKALRGRTDKQFCDLMCRNTYHNQINKQKNKIIKSTLYHLMHNRQILIELLSDKPLVMITPESLLEAGYRTNFATQIEGDCFYCFDTVLEKLEDGLIAVYMRDSA